MTTLKFTTVDQHLVLQRQPVVASGDKNSVLIQIQLCSMWDEFDVKVAFYKDGNRDFVLDIPLENGECMIPPEMLDTPCVLNIGVWGKDASGRHKTSTMVKYRVHEGTPIEAGVTLIDVSDGTADEDQVLEGATFFAGDAEMKTGNVKTYEEGDPVYMTPYTENDPTVPDWAKQSTKPTYTAEEVGARPNTWTPTADDLGATVKGTEAPNSTALSIKPVPADAAPYAEVVEVGGLTRKSKHIYNGWLKTEFEISSLYNGYAGICGFFDVPKSWHGKTICYSALVNNTSTNQIAELGIWVIDKNGTEINLKSKSNRTFVYAGQCDRIMYSVPITDEYVSIAFGLSVLPPDAAIIWSEPMVEFGDAPSEYEPYFDGLRSAEVTEVESVGVNLTTPQAVYAGANSYLETVVDGRNCVRFTSGTIIRNTPIAFKPNTQYTVSFYAKSEDYGGATAANCGFAFFYTDGTYTQSYVSGNHTDWTYFQIKSAEGKTVKEVGLVANEWRAYVYADADTFMFNEGATALPYTPYSRNTLPIPEAVRNIDGYGWGIDDSVYNYIDLDKKQFIKRVGCADMGAIRWSDTNFPNTFRSGVENLKAPDIAIERSNGFIIAKYPPSSNVDYTNIDDKSAIRYQTNILVRDSDYVDAASFEAAMSGVMLYYELAEPIITDISDILPTDNIIGVEGGGTVTMVNEYDYDVPNTITFYEGKNEVVGADTFVGDLQGTASRALADGEGKQLASREWVLEQLAAMMSGGE